MPIRPSLATDPRHCASPPPGPAGREHTRNPDRRFATWRAQLRATGASLTACMFSIPPEGSGQPPTPISPDKSPGPHLTRWTRGSQRHQPTAHHHPRCRESRGHHRRTAGPPHAPREGGRTTRRAPTAQSGHCPPNPDPSPSGRGCRRRPERPPHFPLDGPAIIRAQRRCRRIGPVRGLRVWPRHRRVSRLGLRGGARATQR